MFFLYRIFWPVPAAWAGGLFLAVLVSPVRANAPASAIAAGANVTLVDNGNGTITLANGLLSAVIKKSSAQILKLTYNNVQVTDGGTSSNNAFYWQGSDQNGSEQIPANCTYSVVADPASSSGNFADISLAQTYPNSGATTNDPVDSDFHFSLFRGATGIYVTEIITRPAGTAAYPSGYPAGVANPYSFTCKLGTDVFDWLSLDALRNKLMPTVGDWNNGTTGINAAPKEVELMTTGALAGQFECKYDYSGDLGSVTAWGWSSDVSNTGIWMIAPSHEYYTCGPLHREILPQIMLINNPFNGGHYGFTADLTFTAGETWTRVYGPFLVYLNKVAPGTPNAPAALFADAQAQAAAEQGAWPYSWFQNPAYVQASGRGAVTGRIVINDAGNPFASPAGLWVGIAQTPPSTIGNSDFQLFGKNYQFWVKTAADGTFTIPHVIAGNNYNLYAFGPGAIGQLELDNFANVTAGATTALGNVTWTPSGVAARIGPTVFEIGVPDRDSTEFLHGADYWHGNLGNATSPASNWGQFQNYPGDFPGGGPSYTVGQSRWDTDWDYVQPAVYNATSGNYDGSTSTIHFTLPQAPAANSTASIYIAQAANYAGPLIVTVNGVVNGGSTARVLSDVGNTTDPLAVSNSTVASTGYFAKYSSTTMIRMGSHGIWSQNRLIFPGSALHQGSNTVTINMRKGGYFANSALYDYLRLELTGFVPAAPVSATATAAAGQVDLSWFVVPGAASYTIQRAGAANGTFSTLATVAGPVAGSGSANATYTDSAVTNGITYYYKILANSPAGSSAALATSGARPVQTFAQWIAAALPGQTSPAVIGPAANPAADGLGNLLKYFLALDPAAAAIPPSAVSVAPDGQGRLVLTFRMAKNLTGVSYQIQQSADLVNWTDTGLTGAVQQDLGDGYLMQAIVPPGSDPLFLRLWVSLSP